MIRHTEHLSVHGQYIGVAQGGETGWVLEPYKQPLLEALGGQPFPTREAMLAAIDKALGAAMIAQMDAAAAESMARWQRDRALARSHRQELHG
jgi:hypothetical protein